MGKAVLQSISGKVLGTHDHTRLYGSNWTQRGILLFAGFAVAVCHFNILLLHFISFVGNKMWGGELIAISLPWIYFVLFSNCLNGAG